MKKQAFPIMALVLAAGISFVAPARAADQTFVGSIGDSMCGAKHMMPGQSDRDCTLACVKEGSKFILIGPGGKIYQLSDQKTPQQFAGAKVKVTGTLSGDVIKVTSMVAAK